MSAWENGKRILYTAHRVSFRAYVGDIPDGMLVCHTCDNRKCFNPKHLFLGSMKDNSQDMMAKGRGVVPKNSVHWTQKYPERIKRGEAHHLVKDSSVLPRGDVHHNAKFTDDQIREIRSSSLTYKELAKVYGVAQATLCSIRLRKTWKHVI